MYVCHIAVESGEPFERQDMSAFAFTFMFMAWCGVVAPGATTD